MFCFITSSKLSHQWFEFSDEGDEIESRLFSTLLTFFSIENFLINKKNETPKPKKVGVANANYYRRGHTFVVVVAS